MMTSCRTMKTPFARCWFELLYKPYFQILLFYINYPLSGFVVMSGRIIMFPSSHNDYKRPS